MVRQTRAKRIAIATLFGVLLFISKIVLPTPIDKMLIVFQAFFLALGFMIIGRLGATYVAIVGGLLTSIWRAQFALFTLPLALLYGLMVDVFSYAFRVKSPKGGVKTWRMVASVTVSTALVGILSYYMTVYMLYLLPRNLILEISILAAGLISGIIGGYSASLVWKKKLSPFVKG